MPYATDGAKSAQVEEKPVADSRIETLDYNLKRMFGAIESIECKCHFILNLRAGSEEKDKKPTPLESDFITKIDNRLNDFAALNDRLEHINQHLAKIVG